MNIWGVDDRYVALLRGINVGGHAIVSMAELRKSFAGMGFEDVATYIQSGNVVFSAPGGAPDAAELEAHLLGDFKGVTSAVVVRSAGDLDRLVTGNPYLTSGADLKTLYVSFLVAAPPPEKATAFAVPEGATERMTLMGEDVCQCFPDGYGRTKLGGTWLEKALGVKATTRNWRTVTTLHRMALE